MEKKNFLQPQHASFAKAASPKSKKHHLQLVIAQMTSPRKINPRKNLLLTRLQPAFPTGISLGANVLRQVSNILRYVCCISFMITQMTPPRKTFLIFYVIPPATGSFSMIVPRRVKPHTCARHLFANKKSRRTNLSKIRAAASYAVTVYQRTKKPASFIFSS